MRSSSALVGLLVLAVSALSPVVSAAQGGFDAAMARLAREVAEDLRNAGFSRERPASLYVRPPFDGTFRVVCPPLSRRLSQAMRGALPDALLLEQLDGTRTVVDQGFGAGQTMLNLSWRAAGDDTLELSYLLGDLSGDRIADIGGGVARLPLSELTEAENGCLAELQVVNRTEVAEDVLFVYREPDLFSREIAVIEKGRRFRLLGRMPYAGGDWAVVRLLDGAPGGPFDESVGFASLPETALERAAREQAERERRDVEERVRAEQARSAEAAREAEARAQREAEAREAEDARRAEEAREQEGARRAAEARRLEAERLAEETRRAEEARRLDEARRAADLEEAARLAQREAQRRPGETALGGYTALLSARDRVSSRGVALIDAWGVLQQDRANFHRFGLRDPEDEGDSLFTSLDARRRIPEMLQQGDVAPDLLRDIPRGDVLVDVEILRAPDDRLYLRVTRR